MAHIGAFTFVLHSHLPYARLAGRWPHGEEWIHEAATETYIPLLEMLYDLREEGINTRLTLSITPILAEQLADPDVLQHLDQYLEMRIAASRRDLDTFSAEATADDALYELAGWYADLYERARRALHDRFHNDLIGAFRQLQDEGRIEILTSAATHGYLPLLGHDSSIHAQLQTGIVSYRRMFGRDPAGVWLPECGYRPAYIRRDGSQRPGLEYFIARLGLNFFFSETHQITGGRPVGVAAGDVIGPYSAIKRRYVIPTMTSSLIPERAATPYLPYWVADSLDTRGGIPSPVAVIGRNNRVGEQVWSADWGYPGDYDYREFYRRAATSGNQYWRISGDEVDLGAKDIYKPDWAAFKIDQHAEHFAHLVGDQLRDYHATTGEYGLISANYDTELFGHWWFEGVQWLGKVLRHLANNPDVEMVTVSQHLERRPPNETLAIPEGSWGAGGGHFMWENPETAWMWPMIHETEARMEALAVRFTQPTDDERTVLNQAAREALLLQSSDWGFLITSGQAREYAIGRFNQHRDRFDTLARGLESGSPNAAQARELYELDKVFPDIDYRWFAPGA